MERDWILIRVLRKYDFDCECFKIFAELPEGKAFDLGNKREVALLKEYIARMHGYPIRYSSSQSERLDDGSIESLGKARKFVKDLIRGIEKDIKRVTGLIEREIHTETYIKIPFLTISSIEYVLLNRCSVLLDITDPLCTTSAEELFNLAKETHLPGLIEEAKNLLIEVKRDEERWSSGDVDEEIRMIERHHGILRKMVAILKTELNV